MSHHLIASLSVAFLAGALPLAAYATEGATLPTPDPLASTTHLTRGGFSMLRIKAGPNGSAARMAPVIYGPDFVPKWQMNPLTHDTEATKLQGDRFRFR